MSSLIYDPAGTPPVIGATANESVGANGVSVLQHEAVPAATSFDIQGRLGVGAPWIKIGSTVAASAPAAFVLLGATYHQVRVFRTGAGNFKVWA